MSAALTASNSISLVVSIVSIPAIPVLASVISSAFLSVGSVSASEDLSRVTVVQNLLFQLVDMIKWLAYCAGHPRLRVLSVSVAATISVSIGSVTRAAPQPHDPSIFLVSREVRVRQCL